MFQGDVILEPRDIIGIYDERSSGILKNQKREINASQEEKCYAH